MNAIDREEAIRIIASYPGPVDKSVVRRLLTQMDEAGRWIPVTERLPEDSDFHDFWETPDGAVLWCNATGEIGVGWYYESTKNWCDLWDNGVRDVVAWMPLPNPYKGGEQDATD